MQLTLFAAFHCLLEERHVVQLFVCHQHVNFRNVHADHAPSADVHVPHFAVPHLPFWQSNSGSRSADQRIRKFSKQLVVSRLPCQRNRVPFRFGAISPSIQHSQHNRFWSFRHSPKEYTSPACIVTPEFPSFSMCRLKIPVRTCPELFPWQVRASLLVLRVS